MLGLHLPQDTDAPLNILCLGAHCDDIEIGCGGTLLTLLSNYSNVTVFWRVFSSTPARKREGNAGADRFCDAADELKVSILEFRDGYLPCEGSAPKEALEQIKTQFAPDIIFTHYGRDLHQDHRLVSELTWNTFRDHLILEYEIPKWDGDLGVPNVYVPIEQETAEVKISALLETYVSQQQKAWFSADLFRSIMRIRGMECNSRSNLAEAFYSRKLLLGLPE